MIANAMSLTRMLGVTHTRTRVAEETRKPHVLSSIVEALTLQQVRMTDSFLLQLFSTKYDCLLIAAHGSPLFMVQPQDQEGIPVLPLSTKG